MKEIIKNIRFLYLKKVKWRKYSIGKNLYVGMRVYIWAKNKITIGDNFYMGRDSQIETDCTIGNNVIFGNKVAIVGKYDHHFQAIGIPIRLAPRIRDDHYNWKGLHLETIIEDDVWLGYGCIIMAGVKISKGCIVAAGSVVTKDLEPYHIYGGNPAKIIRPRFETEEDLEEHLRIEKNRMKEYSNYTGVHGIEL